MKKAGVLLVLALTLFYISSFVLAADNETDTDSDEYKIELAFECLEDYAEDCSDLTTSETALIILATPDNIFDDCVDDLLDSEKSDNYWSTDNRIRDTALAILALRHAGKDTSDEEEWLLDQTLTPDELDWFIQLDSNEEMTCSISFGSNTPEVTVSENKKVSISGSTSGCLDEARNDYWIEIDEDCYDEEFSIKCDQDFVSGLLYEGGTSTPKTTYVLEGTESSPAYDSNDVSVRSKCFGTGNSCNYEGTLWAALALEQAGLNIDDYIPYIVATSNDNEEYLPEAFVYMLTNYEDYATRLVADQELSGFWIAKDSVYKQYYDTAIALLSLGSSSADAVSDARNRLLFSQGSNGCWRNKVKDTAIVLWALEGRSGRSSEDSTVSTTYCTDAGYFCIASSDCPESEDVGDNFYCPSLSNTCCINENLKTCSEYGGQECSLDTFCVGNERSSSDVETCCTGTCEDRPEETECEAEFYTCSNSCSSTQEEVSYDCEGTQVCCRTKTTATTKKSRWWVWLILILILAVLGALAYIYREKLKEEYKKIKSKLGKKGKDSAGSSQTGPGPRPGMPPRGMPPRPGFPPVVRQQQQYRAMPRYKEDPAMQETFRKLRKIASK